MSTTAMAQSPQQSALANVNDRTVLPVPQLRQLVGSRIDVIRDALPEKMKGAAPRFVISLATACQSTPKLAECTALSLFGGLVKAANLGLELGGECWLIPRGGQATFQIGWKGIVTLLYRNPRVVRVAADVVRAGDEFDHVNGTESRIVHKYGAKRGEPTHFYCIIKLQGGEAVHKVMSVAEVDAHRIKFSESGRAIDGSRRGVWKEHFESMGLKTVVILASKTAPRCIELPSEAELDEVAAKAVDELPEQAVQPRPDERKASEGEIVGEGGSDKAEVSLEDLDAIGKAVATKEGAEFADVEFEVASLWDKQSFAELSPEQRVKAAQQLEKRAR